MLRKRLWPCVFLAILGLFIIAGQPRAAQIPQKASTAQPSTKPAAKTSLPAFSVIVNSVTRYITGLPDYHPGGILARSDVAPLGPRLKSVGWVPADWPEMVQRVSADDSFLVGALRTPAGRKFATQIAKYPLAYDRLDRIARLADGRKTVEALIRGPDGYKLIEYMTTSRGGSVLGRQLAHNPHDRNFNSPTGRIYTLEGLLEELKTRYDASKKPSPPTQAGRGRDGARPSK